MWLKKKTFIEFPEVEYAVPDGTICAVLKIEKLYVEFLYTLYYSRNVFKKYMFFHHYVIDKSPKFEFTPKTWNIKTSFEYNNHIH